MKTKYLANREWSKSFKFNNYWYLLKSLFDNGDDDDLFDFDNVLNDREKSIELDGYETNRKCTDFDDHNINDDHFAIPRLYKRVKRPHRKYDF